MMQPLAQVPADVGPLVPLSWTAPAAVLIFGVLLLYWRRLRPRDVPRSRRRIRRANTIVHFILTLALVYALSVADGDRDLPRFAVAWIGVLLLLILTISLAILDSVNTMRLHRRVQSRLRREAMEEMGEALQSHRGPTRDAPR